MANMSVYRNRKLQEKINSCKSSARIDLRKQKITDVDMELVIQEAIGNKQCTMLWLTENQMTSQSISMLAAALHSNVTLEGLSLCQNGIADAEVCHLSRALSNRKSKLTRLALTSNDITDEGVHYLANMLMMNCSLTQLWLGFNQITDRGVKILADALAYHNTTLHVLSLSWNNLVTDASVDVVLNMLEYNQTLRTVCLSNCNLSDVSKKKLRETTKLYNEFYLDL